MTTQKKALILLVSLWFCFSCENIQKKGLEKPLAITTDTARKVTEVSIDLVTENRYAYIVECFESNDEKYVKVDYVDYGRVLHLKSYY